MVFRIIFLKFIIPTRHNNRRHKIIIYNTQNAGWPSSYIRGQPRIDQTESKSRAQPRASASATKLRISESIALKSLKLEMSAYICIRSTTRDETCGVVCMWCDVTWLPISTLLLLHLPSPPTHSVVEEGKRGKPWGCRRCRCFFLQKCAKALTRAGARRRRRPGLLSITSRPMTKSVLFLPQVHVQ